MRGGIHRRKALWALCVPPSVGLAVKAWILGKEALTL